MDFTNEEKRLIDKEATEMTTRTSRIPVKTFRYQGHACDYYWGFDLIDFHDDKTVSQNKEYKYIMILLDFYSRYVFAIPLKTKNTPEIIAAFEIVFRINVMDELGNPRIPTFICSDEESAITSHQFKAFAESLGISVYHAFGKHGVAPVESFIRTFKEKLAFFWTRQRRNWVDHFVDIVNNYNKCKHSALINLDGENVSPYDVYIMGVEIKEEPEAYPEDPRTKYDLKVGDKVRFKINKDLMSTRKKSLLPNYSIDVYKVTNIVKTKKNQGENTRPNIAYRIKCISDNQDLTARVDPVFAQELRNANKRLFYRNELKKSRMDASEIRTLNNVTETLLNAQDNPRAILDNMDTLGPHEAAVARAVNREAAEIAEERVHPGRRGRRRRNSVANAFARHREDSDSDYEPSE